MIRGGGIAVGIATALVIVAISIVPFSSPPWMSFAQGRAQVALWTGWPESTIRTATNAIVGDLITGGAFDIVIDSETVLSEPERSHMRDVRGLFAGFYGLAVVAAIGIVVALRRDAAGARRAIRAGAIGAVVGMIAAGVVVVFAFDAAFGVFHALFFASGSSTFDPRTDRLVQLFPDQLWVETTAAVGLLAFVIGLAMARVAGPRRA